MAITTCIFDAYGTLFDVAAAARQGGQEFDALNDTAEDCEVAIEVARRLTDDGVEFGAAARVWSNFAPDADDAIAVGEPDLIVVTRRSEAI